MHPITRWARTALASLLLVAAGIAGAPGPAATASPRTAAEPTAAALAAPAQNVHIFYYSWYGSPAVNGSYRHWQQGDHTPPQDVGANFYPTLGAYDSGDVNTINQHMAWISQAGVGTIVYSWWGQGSYEDNLTARVLTAAAQYGLKVAWHLEPYTGRTAASTVADINYINSRYGSSPAFYRDAANGNRPAFYVFESLRITDWSALAQVRANNIVLAQTTDTSKVANFGGMYTYDGIAGATAPGWANAAAYCEANGLVWAPSVAPGYLDDRAVPGNTTPTLDRDNGAAYDRQWSNALGTPTRPDWVSITSFNEWHEGSTIEPASANPPAGHGYLTYSGAYGRTGVSAETAYLDRTRYWVEQFNPAAPTSPVISLRARVNTSYVAADNAGAAPLIANRTAVGPWEQFDRLDAGNGTIALRAKANGLIVTANGGTAPLIADKTTIGTWETFQIVNNTDGSVSLRATANNMYVAAEGAGAQPLIANRAAIGAWERFDLIT
ncbi:glycosyl hydrolase family 99 [Micromonospora pisi]|uniref:Glycosyl hydrolase family 99 n=1 Tax=Micromonospora pisi TaxID=589240 RepID=A0A495JB58_9ACTN|nr:glycoside hydrolase family 99 protein [Micromonospora pisi]RKR86246.1 glycosyl hydrolase family 99 [Micromonospora pisi]